MIKKIHGTVIHCYDFASVDLGALVFDNFIDLFDNAIVLVHLPHYRDLSDVWHGANYDFRAAVAEAKAAAAVAAAKAAAVYSIEFVASNAVDRCVDATRQL
jgi:hypothetical protein